MESPSPSSLRTGWAAALTSLGLAALFFLAVTGLLVTFAPFHAAVEWTVLVHTLVGVLTLLPLAWYSWAHWRDYRRYDLSDLVLLGYTAVLALLVCSVSGLVVTWQGLFAVRMSPLWRNVHLVSTFVALAAGVPHVVLTFLRVRARRELPIGRLAGRVAAATVAGLAAIVALTLAYPGERYDNALPADYTYPYGPDRPFAPSLAVTAGGGGLDARSLAGSQSCGTAGCHVQIVDEWTPSAHRYAAMDPLFQKVQSVMAAQNGPESTRYCGGCHDPISLFSGAKRFFADATELTAQAGFEEGVSCLACHGIRETDLQGNANYVMTQPAAYLWQWADRGAARLARDFLIRTYPDGHQQLSKRMFKAPEYCAACHKQFVDQEVNRVGWVQLQNQYDNWKASHWFVDGDPAKTIECRECHMPLVDSTDPAAGDGVDYNRSPADGKHRSHRFVAANTLVPRMLELPGWQQHVELTERWLQGRFAVPEIADKWADGAVVQLALEVPEQAAPGSTIPVRVVMTANKVGHDFPTGPLDIIQSWIEIHVVDERGHEIFSSGTRDERHFIEPGSFLFKAEPVDQYGNLIDRHNLWEMVGVRYRRALFPGYSDQVEYLVDCPATMAPEAADAPPLMPRQETAERRLEVPSPADGGRLEVTAILYYRKVDQFLINFLLGEDSGLTAPVVEMTRAVAAIQVGEVGEAGAAVAAVDPEPPARRVGG